MARYKAIDTSPRFLAVDLEKQNLPGSFEHAVHHLLEHEFDLTLFDTRYCNDLNGATAYPPGMLLKVILCAYARGVVSSRSIERLCREHVTFIALSGDSAPHFTTLVGTGRAGPVRFAAEGCGDKNIQAHARLSVGVSVIGAGAENACRTPATGWVRSISNGERYCKAWTILVREPATAKVFPDS